MDQIGFALPVLSGKTEDARAFFQELEQSRKQEFAASEQRINITKELWFLQQTPQGDLLVAYIESPNAANALQQFSQSQEMFDQWFKRRLAEVTGVDLNNPPPWPLSEQVSNYE
jgi:ribosomal protein L16 Arg81 hydroxylase